MADRRFLTTMALLAALAGCAELRAERPLFSPADSAGPPPLAEGVWIAISEDCPDRYARTRGRFPADCTPFELRHAEDGAWRISARLDLAFGLSREERHEAESSGPFRLIIAPAVERVLRADEFASLYLAQMHAETDADSVTFLVIAPAGGLPATEAHVALIGCNDILRDGPIEGITPEYSESGNQADPSQRYIIGCIASTQAAVRQAARRTVVEDFDTLIGTRYLRVRP